MEYRMRVPYVDLGKQNTVLNAELSEAVSRVLRRGDFILGHAVQEFESRMASYLGVRHVVGVSSGTAALVLALRALGIGPGDEVLTVSHSFLATATAVCLSGATPVFLDIDPRSMLLDPARIAEAVTPRTRALVAVHLNGFACDMQLVSQACLDKDIHLVEDCAQAIGTSYRGRRVGSFGTGCFSLHPLKVLSACGDAGFISTDNEDFAVRLREMRNLGLKDRDHACWLSGNDRLDTLQAAILCVKMNYLDPWIEARTRHAQAYLDALDGLVTLPPESADCGPNWNTFVVRHPERDRLYHGMRARGVDVKIHYPIAIHQQGVFAGYPHRPLPVTEATVASILSLPVSPELTDEQRDFTIAALRGLL